MIEIFPLPLWERENYYGIVNPNTSDVVRIRAFSLPLKRKIKTHGYAIAITSVRQNEVFQV